MQPMNPTEKTTLVQWNHPTKGQISEEVCDVHEQELLKALRILGIGSLGTPSSRDICWRCVYDGYPFKVWMDKLV